MDILAVESGASYKDENLSIRESNALSAILSLHSKNE
jgi:hypothetical protein